MNTAPSTKTPTVTPILLTGHQFNIIFFIQEGWTALSLSSWKGRTEIVEILVQAGADVNIQGQVNSKPIMLDNVY